MEVVIEKMELKHIDSVYDVECESFSVPWSKKSFRDEIEVNEYSVYFVALLEHNVIGYIGMRHIVNEGHITNVAVKDEYRRLGVGQKLLDRLIEAAIDKEMIGITLEVRIGNTKAQRLYTKNAFKPEGIRKGYYTDPKEDAIIMWRYFNQE